MVYYIIEIGTSIYFLDIIPHDDHHALMNVLKMALQHQKGA